MPDFPAHATHRAVVDLTLDATRSLQRRRALDEQMGFVEVEQQFQVAIDGAAAAGLTFADVTIDFDYYMVYAPGQRDSELDRPHMTFGVECAAAVMISAAVKSWITDEQTDVYRGAVVTVSALGSGAFGETTSFSGYLHLTFQGFGASDEDESFEDLDVSDPTAGD